MPHDARSYREGYDAGVAAARDEIAALRERSAAAEYDAETVRLIVSAGMIVQPLSERRGWYATDVDEYEGEGDTLGEAVRAATEAK